MKDKIKTLKIIHIALCAGLLLSYVILGDLLRLENIHLPDIDMDSGIYLAIPLTAVFLSSFLFKNKLRQVNPEASLDENFGTYQTACIIRWALIEGAAFMILLVKPSLVIFGLLLVAYLVFLHPTQDRMEQDLMLRR